MRAMLARLAVVVVVCTVAVATVAEAQQQLHLGPRLSYNFDAEEFGLGAQFSYPVARRIEFYPSFDYYFVDPGSLWALNADAKYRVPTEGEWLYLGGGLSIARASFNGNSATDAGLNLFGGLETRIGRIHPFAEGRLTLGDGSTFQISAGLNFTLGNSVEVE